MAMPRTACATLESMIRTVRGRVKSGRLHVDEATDLPDGREVHLAVVDEGDDLDDEDRARLHAAILEGIAEADRGEGVPADEVIQELEAKRRG